MSIAITNLTKKYGHQLAVDDVSFEVKKGEILGFLGPNGAGKSTTLKVIAGFIPQTSGRVLINGHDTADDSILTKKQIGYLPEHNPLYLDMYVQEYLFFLTGLHGVPHAMRKDRVHDMIRLCGLTKESRKRIGQLSKGYRQRTGLAAALIHDPKVVILDEPTTGLDPNQIVEIRALIRRVSKEKTVIFSTHIMQEVEAICDRAVILNHGQIVANSTIDDLRSFQDRQAIQVRFSEEVSLQDILTIEGVEKVEREGRDWVVYGVKGADLSSVIFDFAVLKGIRLEKLIKNETSLEQLFHDLTMTK